MNLQMNAITPGVRDLNRAKQFYSEGLGCPIEQDQGGYVSFKLGNGSSTLALYAWDALAADAGVASAGVGFRGLTLNYLVSSEGRVDEVLARAKRAGGRIARVGATRAVGRILWLLR